LDALAEALGCAATDGEVQARLAGVGNAALHEYADMITGEQTMTSVTELRERRLVALIRFATKSVPDTHWIARTFNVPATTAKSMLRGISARHRRRIIAEVNQEVTDFLAACTQDSKTEKYSVAWTNPVLIEMLNSRLEEAKLSKEKIIAHSDVGGEWIIPNGSYEWLKDNS
ncbi:hypothetical protein N9D37_00960, partial [Erythrobacter sp.]|nr:hypothetical protein [Erythrobacter sp.]